MMRIGASLVTLMLAVGPGCRGETAMQEPARARETGGPEVAGPASEAASAAAVGDWGVEIAAPPGARVVHEAAADRHTIALRYGVEVGLSRIDLPAPANLADARRGWDQGDQLRLLGEGTTADGVMYAVRAFRVRDGRSSGGQHVHFFIDVARVYAVIPVNARSRVECTGYVEHGVDGADDADLAAVRAVCLSLRRR